MDLELTLNGPFKLLMGALAALFRTNFTWHNQRRDELSASLWRTPFSHEDSAQMPIVWSRGEIDCTKILNPGASLGMLINAMPSSELQCGTRRDRPVTLGQEEAPQKRLSGHMRPGDRKN